MNAPTISCESVEFQLHLSLDYAAAIDPIVALRNQAIASE